jgi:hypothetical protein
MAGFLGLEGMQKLSCLRVELAASDLELTG